MAAATSAVAVAVLVVVAVVLLGVVSVSSATTVSHDGRSLVIDGVRRIILSGSIHYPRSTPEMWPELIEKAKLGGLDAIETYVFWNAHEPQRRQYDFEGNLDLVRFVKEVQAAGLYAILRIGPYVCAEWNYGGFPAWLRAIPGLEMRTDNEQFKMEMQTFTTLIVNMMKEEKLLAPQGGPIILAQIENEYGNVMDVYGDAGKRYINWCANMAVSLDIGLPWIMCQQADAPHPIINTCNGFYCDDFEPNTPNSPKMWTENWTGWFKAWDKADPHRPAEDVAYAVARFFERGGTLQNYYMYHGGTNFGRTSGGPYITTTYDYDAPLDEYGNLNQPKWGHLKELHHALKSMEAVLTQGDMTNLTLGDGVTFTKYSSKYAAGCFISNTNQSTDAKVTLEGRRYLVPAWSVSLLPDCNEEVYNTAKVNTQKTILVKKPVVKSSELSWTWKAEDMRRALGGKGDFTKFQLTDQILTSLDASDYLWYMTRVDVPKSEAQMTLRVNTTGHALYAFVNGRLVGSKYASNGDFMFVMEIPIALRAGKNHISLLSATVGLKNYGPQFELVPAGIVGGPVKLVRNEDNHTMDLSTRKWSYKIGLKGEEEQLYRRDARPTSEWLPGSVPTNRPFTWYKTTFNAPLGAEPVVVDLLGMGKGEAWVNGRSIGRFWPVSAATSGHCGHCDYRVAYNADDSECRTGCSGPAQRWYHVPRSFLQAGEENVLVLFEEAGGDPSRVNFQRVTRQQSN